LFQEGGAVMRKLVTICTIKNIRPIEDADRIEVATMNENGWQVVVRKDDFSPGDKAVFFQVDSYLPIEPIYKFLQESSYKQLPDGREGYRLRTVRLRGALSQGLLMSIDVFDELDKDIEIGTDVTDLLNVKKYEPPIPVHLSGKVIGKRPGFIPETDQERIQNLPDYFTQFRDVEFEVTEKVDGSSCSIFRHHGKFGVCSRNLQLAETDKNTHWQVVHQLEIQEWLPDNLAIQAELAGPKIQKNRLQLNKHQLFCFDIFDISSGKYLLPDQRQKLVKDWPISHVPIIDTLPVLQKYRTVDKVLDYAKGQSSITPSVLREGLVFKSCELINNWFVLSFKAVNNDYLESGDS